MADIKKMFSPEFRNRLDAIVSFQPLPQEIIIRVVDKFLIELEEQLHEKKVEISVSDEVKNYLARNGFDPAMGARPMQRLIQDSIRSLLADELLFGKLVNGGRVDIEFDSKKEKIILNWPKSVQNKNTSKPKKPIESLEL